LGRVPILTVQRVVTVMLVLLLFDGGMHIGWRRFRGTAAPVVWIGVAGTAVRRSEVVMPDEMRTVHRPLRWSLTGLADAGAGLAVTAAILAFADGNVRDGIVYTVVAAGLSLIAVGVARSLRWVVAVTLVVCAG
jgi:magnesium-transporting ATPase (P-type)